MLWLWAVLGALAFVGVLYINYRGLPWSWGPWVEVPPAEHLPLVTSARAMSAHTIRLTLSKRPGEVEVERYRPLDASFFRFYTTLNELDDTDLAGNSEYRYRARYATTPPGSWSHPEKQGTEGRTLALDEAFYRGPLTFPEPDWQGFCLVQRFEAGVLSRSGEQVSIIIRASTVGLSIDRIYISQADPTAGMDPYDSVEYRAAMQDIMFIPPIVIPPSNEGKTHTVHAALYTLDHTKPLLIAFDFSTTPASGIMYKEVPPDVAVAYFKTQAPFNPNDPEARKMDRTGYTRWPTDPTKGGLYLIERIEVGDQI